MSIVFGDPTYILPKSGDKTRTGRKVGLEVGFRFLCWRDTVTQLPRLSFGQRDFDRAIKLKAISTSVVQKRLDSIYFLPRFAQVIG